jgi:hypothetical protein
MMIYALLLALDNTIAYHAVPKTLLGVASHCTPFLADVLLLQMTVAEATDIADTALEHTVLSILRAVQVSLSCLRGTFY